MPAFKPPDLSENTWLGAIVGISAFILGVVSVAAVVWQDVGVLVAFAAGAGWALCFAVWMINGATRRRLRQVETDLEDARRQADHWCTTSKSIADASTAMVGLLGSTPGPTAATPRASRPRTARQGPTP